MIPTTTAAMWPLPADLNLRHTVGTYAAQSGANAFLVSPAPHAHSLIFGLLVDFGMLAKILS